MSAVSDPVSVSDVSAADLSVCRCIHLLTASGIVVGMLAIVAVLDESPRAAVLLLVLAQLIDAIDGPLARRFDIRAVIPKYDGYVLDLVIDYVTCVLVPAVFAWQFGVVGDGPAGQFAIAAMLVTSAMWFSRTDMMTDDHWFRGFPGVWNLVVPTLWLLDTPNEAAVGVLLVLSVLSMTDVEFAHPVQAHQWRRPNLVFVTIWVASMTVLTITFPDRSALTDVALLLGPAWTLGSTAMRHVEQRRLVAASR